jgi:acyl-CoA dehydrogenase
MAANALPLFHLYACVIPLPLIYAVYLGIAEAARDKALAAARSRADDPGLVNLVGEMENDLASARMAQRDMVEAASACEQPAPEITNRILIARTLVGRSAIRVVENAMEVAGGASFFHATSAPSGCSASGRALPSSTGGARPAPLQRTAGARPRQRQ